MVAAADSAVAMIAVDSVAEIAVVAAEVAVAAKDVADILLVDGTKALAQVNLVVDATKAVELKRGLKLLVAKVEELTTEDRQWRLLQETAQDQSLVMLLRKNISL